MPQKFILALIAISFLIVGVYFYFSTEGFTYFRLPYQDDTTAVIEFEGMLTDFNDACYYDGYCVAHVNGYTIITGMGDSPTPPPMGVSDVSMQDIGKQVKVRARKTSATELTISGSKTFYVTVVE